MISRSHRPPQRILLVAAVLATVAGIGCKNTPAGDAAGPPGPASQLGVASGSAQSGTVNTQLVTPLKVVVYDENGQTLSGVSVTWTVNAGEGTVLSPTVTDGSGTATAFWILGKKSGTLADTVIASVTGANNVAVFTASASAGTAAQIVAQASGNAQSVAVGTASAPLVVEVEDAFGNPVSGQKVVWALAAGSAGGAFSGTSTSSGSGTGLDQTTFTPSAAGTNTITASLTGLTAATFTLTAH